MAFSKKLEIEKGRDTSQYNGRASLTGKKKHNLSVIQLFAAIGLMVLIFTIRGTSPQKSDFKTDFGPLDYDDGDNSTGTVFGKRRVLHDHADLLEYIKSAGSTEAIVMEAGVTGRKFGVEGSPARVARNRQRVGVRYVELTPEEERDMASTEQMLWKDLSGGVPAEVLKSCMSCSVLEKTKNRWGDMDACDEPRPSKPWCNSWCPFGDHCIGWYKSLIKDLNDTGGFSRFLRQPQPYRPYLAVFTGGAFVTENGEVYNNDVVMDIRGHCSRKPTLKIRRRRARKFAYKKVYVVDHVWRGPYHEMADAAARLFYYHSEILADPEIMIHATTDFPKDDADFDIHPWEHHNVSQSQIDIFSTFGIDRSRFVTGDVYADEVVTAQVHCSSSENLYQFQEQRLRKAIHRYLWANGVPKDIPIGRGNILVLQRRLRRRVTNHDDLIAGLQSIAGNKKIEVFDDGRRWTQLEIWEMFYRADIIIAPHGAGLVNIVVARKNAVVYEFIQPAFENTDPANCNFNYKSLSLFLGLRYYSDLPLKMDRPTSYFSASQNRMINPPTSMTIDVQKSLTNIQMMIRKHVLVAYI